MSKHELIERLLAGEARIDSNRMRRGMIEYHLMDREGGSGNYWRK